MEQEKEQTKPENNRKKSKKYEVMRFIVVGVICTLIDFGINYLVTYLLKPLSEKGGAYPYVTFAIATTVGFVISTIINFSLSRNWVFQNVDKNINTKSQKAFWTYFGLGAGGWILGVALMEVGLWLCNLLFKMNLSLDITSNQAGASTFSKAFWAYVICFGLKTLVVLFYNYFTRKHLIFKEPKEEGTASATTEAKEEKKEPAKAENKPEPARPEEKDRLCTPDSFRKILSEEMDKTLGPKPHPLDEKEARAMIQEELKKQNQPETVKKTSAKPTPKK
jgi:putative flippase GtrA